MEVREAAKPVKTARFYEPQQLLKLFTCFTWITCNQGGAQPDIRISFADALKQLDRLIFIDTPVH